MAWSGEWNQRLSPRATAAQRLSFADCGLAEDTSNHQNNRGPTNFE